MTPAKGLIFGVVDYRTTLRNAAKRAGLPAREAAYLSNHDFRHGFGTDMAQHADPVTLQYLMGHRNATTTAKYIHPTAQRAADALKKRGGGL